MFWCAYVLRLNPQTGRCRWNWKQWALWAATPLSLFLLFWVYIVEWYRWRYGYYHIHQAVEALASDDIDEVWTAVDRVSSVRLTTSGCSVCVDWLVTRQCDRVT